MHGLGILYMPTQYFNTIVLNKILYALPVYFGYLTESHKNILSQVLERANHMGFTFHGYDLDQLNEIAQDKLFRHCQSKWNCLYHLFTAKSRPPGAMNLRRCGHDFMLPNIKYGFNKCHYIACSLFIMSKLYVFVLCVHVCIAWTFCITFLSFAIYTVLCN